jgi:hypothetical protein
VQSTKTIHNHFKECQGGFRGFPMFPHLHYPVIERALHLDVKAEPRDFPCLEIQQPQPHSNTINEK